MRDNKLTTLAGVGNLDLNYLDVRNNQIEDISALAKIDDLSLLGLGNNLIKNIEWL